MRQKISAAWKSITASLSNGVDALDRGLSKIPGMGASAPQAVTTVSSRSTTPYKAPTKSWFQKNFRDDERLKLEAYMKASTQAEQDAILATMKPDMGL